MRSFVELALFGLEERHSRAGLDAMTMEPLRADGTGDAGEETAPPPPPPPPQRAGRYRPSAAQQQAAAAALAAANAAANQASNGALPFEDPDIQAMDPKFEHETYKSGVVYRPFVGPPPSASFLNLLFRRLCIQNVGITPRASWATSLHMATPALPRARRLPDVTRSGSLAAGTGATTCFASTVSSAGRAPRPTAARIAAPSPASYIRTRKEACVGAVRPGAGRGERAPTNQPDQYMQSHK